MHNLQFYTFTNNDNFTIIHLHLYLLLYCHKGELLYYMLYICGFVAVYISVYL